MGGLLELESAPGEEFGGLASAVRGKPKPAGVGGVLGDHKGDVMLIFSKSVGIKEPNETEVLAILEALRLIFLSCQDCEIPDFFSCVIKYLNKCD